MTLIRNAKFFMISIIFVAILSIFLGHVLAISTQDMASIPQSMQVAKSCASKKKKKINFENSADASQPALCYNNKMMNSIWGQYNRNSVHNFKAVQGDNIFMTPDSPMAAVNFGSMGIKGGEAPAAGEKIFPGNSSFYAGEQLKNISKKIIENVFNHA